MRPPGASNLVLLEHINLNLEPRALPLARAFYIDALRCGEDPRPRDMLRRESTLLWANLGLQQFHLPVHPIGEGGASEHGTQRIDGTISLRLAASPAADLAPSALDGVETRVRALGVPAVRESSTRLTLPPCAATLGNAYTIDAAPAIAGRYVGGPDASCRPHPVMREASTHTNSGGMSGTDAEGRVDAILGISLRVPATALPHIASFFRDTLGARVSGAESAEGQVIVHFDGDCADAEAGVQVHADDARDSQRLVFNAVAIDDPSAPPLLPYDGWHIALYLHDFEGAWARVAAAGLLFDNPRFSDRVGTLEQARLYAQFRTLMLGARSGVALELEIRSRAHPSCPLPGALGDAGVTA